MTTQIVSSKLNGQIRMAQVETVMLAVSAILGLWLLRKLDPEIRLTGGERGVAPRRHQLQSGLQRTLAMVFGWGLAVVALLPHATLVLLSFVPPNTWTTQALPPILNTGNYVSLFSQAERLRPGLNSLWMAAVATILAAALAFAASRYSVRYQSTGLGRILELLIVLPWAIPGTVFAVALSSAFSVNQPWFGRIVLVGTAFILPLAYLVRSLPILGRSTLAGLRQLNPALEEAAASLGAGPWIRLRRIVLPLLRPAIAAGAGLAFVTALGDFVTSIVLYTFETRPVSIEILSSLRLQETGVAAAYGVLLMLVSSAVFLVWGRETGP